MIPKVIHYCWLSGDPWNELIQSCFESWEQVLVGYEFRLWSVEHLPDSPFLHRMMAGREWSYASDYVRLYALYHYGGIYLDLDVELVRSFDGLLHNQCFLGLEDPDIESLGCHVIGSEKGNEFIAKCLKYYDRSWRLKVSFPPTMPRIITGIARRSFAYQGTPGQMNAGVQVCPAHYFSPLSYRMRHIEASDRSRFLQHESYCMHHWMHSWSWFELGFAKAFRKIPWLYMNLNDWKFVIRSFLNE